MIIVDGRKIQVTETREMTLKTIIDSIEKGYLSDEAIQNIQLVCLFEKISKVTKEGR